MGYIVYNCDLTQSVRYYAVRIKHAVFARAERNKDGKHENDCGIPDWHDGGGGDVCKNALSFLPVITGLWRDTTLRQLRIVWQVSSYQCSP